MVRLKYRYIIGQLLDEEDSMKIGETDLQGSIREKISQLFGDCGLGLFGSMTHVKFFDGDRQLFVIRAPRDSFNEVHFALTSICDIKKKSIVPRVLSVCSCDRTCRQKLILFYDKYIDLDTKLSTAEKSQLYEAMMTRLSCVDL